MSEGHARLGPSNHRWPHCPGSVREEAAYPDVAGAAAIDGTGSHLLLESCLIHGVRAEAYEGQIIGANHPENPMGWLVSKDRIDRVQMCLDYVARRVSELTTQFPGATVAVLPETKANPGELYGRDDWWGTCDITIIVTMGDSTLYVEVCDYKDGQGFVTAEGNSQLISYAAGKVPANIVQNQSNVRMTIVQPKTNPVVRYIEVTPGYLKYDADKLAKAAAATDDPDAPLKAGKHCKWCKHGRAENCTAQSEEAVGLIAPIMLDTQGTGSLFELINETFGDITAMDEKKLVEMADARAGIEAVFDKVEAELQRRIESGVPVAGYAMLPGRSSNEWNVSEEEVVKMLKARRLKNSDIYPPKLISPAQVLKLPQLTNEQKEKISQKYITKKAGALKLTKVREQQTVEDKAAVFADVANNNVSFF